VFSPVTSQKASLQKSVAVAFAAQKSGPTQVGFSFFAHITRWTIN
jgi:hypothetical protein